MKRVASLYLPEWAVERLRRRTARSTPPPDTGSASLAPLVESAAAERAVQCDAPRNSGWRPGARWAREEKARVQQQIAALPAHQRPSMRLLGRVSEAAGHPFRTMPPDDGGARSSPLCGEDLLVLSRKVGGQLLVHAASPAARALGLARGMPLTQARACVPGLQICHADPETDRADLGALAVLIARRWCPLVAISGDDGLLLDLTGVAHLHGGEAAMARRLVRLLARSGVTARVAVADTAGAAWALARNLHPSASGGDGWVVVAPGAQAAAIAPLPVAALRIDARAVELMKRLGIDTIGALAKIPRGPLVRRFGKPLALRLDQASGAAPEPLDPVPVPERIVVSQRFAEPIATAEAIEHWLGRLVPRLADALAGAGLGARALLLVGDRIDNVPQSIRIGLARPNRDPAHILRLLLRRVGEIAPGYGIDALHLDVRRADPLAAQPFDEDLATDTSADLGPLVDALANRIGARRLWRMAPVESDVPERSACRVAPLDPPPAAARAFKRDDVRRLDAREADHPWHPRWPRPVRLLARPERLDHVLAELPDHAPRRFGWRGRTYLVARADGPERIAGEWWKRGAERHAVRDYFQVEDEAGARFWLFRRGDGVRAETGDLSWFVHGTFG